MSFSITIPDGPVADFTATAGTAVTNFKRLLEESDNQPSAEAMESVQAAVAGLQTIIASGVVGTGTVSASISGHANPGHEPVQGWANDFLQVSIYCTSPAPTAAAQPGDSGPAGTAATDGAAVDAGGADSGRHQA